MSDLELTAWQRGTLKQEITVAKASAATWRAFAAPGHWGYGIRTPDECERLAAREDAHAAACAARLEPAHV